jgi:hypothetical protein
MKYLLILVAVLCFASVASAHGPQQFRGQFNGHNNQFNEGFRQGLNAARRQQFNGGHVQQFNGHNNQFRFQPRPRFFFSF